MARLQYVIKITDKDDSVILTQIVNPPDLEVTKKLNNFSTASFRLPFSDRNATAQNLKQFNRVDIYEQLDSVEYSIFEGVIRGYEPDLEGVTVNCECFLYLLSRRILFSSDYTASSEAVNVTLDSIFTTMNGLDDTGLTINTTDILTTSVNKEYSRGDDIAKIIKDLAVYTDAEFIIRERQLEFKSTIGTNRTTAGSVEYRDFRFDINNPNENTILDAKAPLDSKDFANAVLGKSGASYSGSIDSSVISEYGRIETTKNFSDSGAGGLGSQTSEFLSLHKVPQQFPKITPQTLGLYFKDIEVGDVVPIYINTGSELFTFDGNYKIVGKTLRRISNAQPVIDLEFSENALGDTDFLEEFEQLKGEVKNLILKS